MISFVVIFFLSPIFYWHNESYTSNICHCRLQPYCLGTSLGGLRIWIDKSCWRFIAELFDIKIIMATTTTSGSNPRKFDEKMAWHKQKAAEQEANIRKILSECQDVKHGYRVSWILAFIFILFCLILVFFPFLPALLVILSVVILYLDYNTLIN